MKSFLCTVGKVPWRRKWQPTPVFLPRESHGQRSLAGYSPWGRKKSDTTERLILILSVITLEDTFSCESEWLLFWPCSLQHSPIPSSANQLVFPFGSEGFNSTVCFYWDSISLDDYMVASTHNVGFKLKFTSFEGISLTTQLN